jgi:hypothetical protein
MPTPPISAELVREAVAEVAKLLATGDYYYKNKTGNGQRSAIQALAEAWNASPATIQRRVEEGWERLGIEPYTYLQGKTCLTEDDLEALPDGLEVLERNAPLNENYIETSRKKFARLIPVKADPFAIACIGDPHLDNKGTDLQQLKQDMDLLAATGIRTVNMGDLLDNFHHAGRLAKVQADNRVSAKEALSLARWFVRDSGVRFDAHILGNHDHWPGDTYATMLNQWVAEAKSRLYDWAVRLTYQWDGGSFSLMCAHDFKGHSKYNPLHALMSRALEDGTDDAYVAGHRHTAAEGGFENGFRNRHYKFVRVNGYKAWDSYAHRNMFPQQKDGASAMFVVDPHADPVNRVRVYMDLSEGVEALTYLKRRYTI